MDGMTNVMLLATILAPIIIGLVEVIKRMIEPPAKYVPVVALLVGLVVGFCSTPFTDLEASYRLWAGAFAGLSATGLFELVKKAK